MGRGCGPTGRESQSYGEVFFMRGVAWAVGLATVLLVGAAGAASAQLAVSANDAKVKLINGKVEVRKDPPADTLTFIDLRATPPKVVAEIEAPASVVGPPISVAISPKEDIALVTSACLLYTSPSPRDS